MRLTKNKGAYNRGGGVPRHSGGLWGPAMNATDGGRDAPLSPRGRLLFGGLCVALGVIAIALLIIAR